MRAWWLRRVRRVDAIARSLASLVAGVVAVFSLARLVFRVDAPALSSNSRMSSRVLTLPHGANHDSYASLDTPRVSTKRRISACASWSNKSRYATETTTRRNSIASNGRPAASARDNASTIAFSARVGRPPS